MKNIILIIPIFLTTFLVVSCKKTGSDTGMAVNASAPTVSTATVTNISGTTATIGGDITKDGGSIVFEAGICYDTASGVDTSKNKIPNYTVSGNFIVALKNLSLLTTYYYKAYAINEKGISYGPELSFFVPIGGYSSSSEVAAANLKAFWAFEGGYIDSVSQTVGTPDHPSALSFVTGLKGQAVEVASPGYINSNIATTIAGLTDFTYVMWIKQPVSLATGPTTYMPFSLNDNSGTFWEHTEFFMLFNNADNSTNSYGKTALMDQWFDVGQVWPKMLDGNWHQLAISYSFSSGAYRVYVDGTLLPQSASTSLTGQPAFESAYSFTLGGPDDATNTANGWMNSLSGDLDEFKIFDKILTSDEVLDLYTLQEHGL